MKKWLKTGKKALSVIMAVMMVLSAWVWVAPTEASAVASSGNYTWRLYINCTNAYTGNAGYYTVTGKTNNGQGSDATISDQIALSVGSDTIFDNGSSAYFPSSDGTTSTAFPYKVYIHTYKNSGPSWGITTDGQYSAELQVKNSSGTWLTVCSGTSSKVSGHGNIDLTISNTSNNFPTPASIKWETENTADTADLTIGKTANVTRTMKFNVYDQYGVRMSSAALTSLSKAPTVTVTASESGTLGTSTSSNIYYTLSSSNTDAYYITITVKPGAKSTTYDSQDITVGASCNSKSLSNRKFTLYDPTYTFTMNPNGGGMITPTTNISKYYYNAFGYTPDASRTGYELIGFYNTQYEDSEDELRVSTTDTSLTSTTYIDSDTTWYAAWQANLYSMTFTYRGDDGAWLTTDPVTEYYGRDIPFPTISTTVNEGIDYTHTFDSWDTANTTVPAADNQSYTAKYNTVTHYAELEALKEQITLSNSKKAEQLYTEGAYTDTSVSSFENTLALAESLVASNPLLSQQTQVDALAQTLENARDNLDIKNYTVIFTDEDGTILKDGYFFVTHGSTVMVPASPEKAYDETNHYAFDFWDYDESDGLDECNYVTDNLIYVASFTAIPHSYTETKTPSTCTADGVITYTCDCGYSYTAADPDNLAGHTWSTDYKELVPATCATVGSEALYCTVCGAVDESSEREIAKLGHNFGEYTEYTPATCCGKGAEVATCSRCQALNAKEIAQKSHVYGEATTVDKTCTTDGYTKETCTLCGFINISSIETATGHETSVEEKKATCVSLGYKKTTCVNCDYEKTEFISATGVHTYSEAWEEVAPASCVGHGVEKRVCTVCNSSTETRLTDIADHTAPADWTVEVPASCDSEGRQVKNCTVCGKELETETIEKLGHNYEAYADGTYAATCTQAGATAEKCSRCGDVNTTVLQPLGHAWTSTTVDADCTHSAYIEHACANDESHNYIEYVEGSTVALHTWTETDKKAADCENDGYINYECSVCKTATKTEILPKLGHSYGEWVVVKEATNTEDGQWKRVCANDENHIEYVTIPAGNHNLVEDKAQYVAPTCSSKGQQVYKCTNHTDCTVTVTVELDEAQHTIAQKVTDATCTTKGKVEAYCSVCDENCEKPFSTTETPVVPHTLDNGTAYDATCTTSGYILYSCTAGCGFSYKEYDSSKPAIEHSFTGTETIISDATCTADGSKTVQCKACSETTTVVIPKTGHSYSIAEKAATCTTAGTKTHTCTNTDCGYTYTEFVEEAAEHNWSNWATLQEATTDSYGIDKRSCTNENCTAVEYRTTAPTGAHEFEKANETPATCTSEGSIEWKCKTHTDCEADYTETLDKLAHTQTISYTAPTCIADGSSKVVCSVCDTEIMSQTISATGIHNYSGDGVVTAEPTCTATGTMTYTCLTDGCTATKTETISAKGHDLTTTVTDAKCGEKGSVVITCSRCDDTSVEKTYELAAKNHSYDEGVETTAPSCEATGEKTYTCTLCGATKTETIAATGHSWSDWVVTPSTNSGAGSVSRECLVAGCDGTETIEIPAGNHNLVVSSETAATCTTEGSITYTCDTAHEGDVNCGITITVALDKLQHELETTKTDATCTGDGSVVTKCKNCDTETHTTIIPATKHNYEGVVTTPATCTVEGTKTYTCSKCNDSYTEAIAKLQHVYTAGSTTAPTCTTNGYTTYKCDNCTSSYTIITESKTGHTFDTANAEVSASCEADGETIVKCACGETLSISTEALGHTYKLDSTAEATCAEGAKETYKCSRCGDSYTVTVSAKSNDYNVHSWNAWVTAKEATNTSIGYKTRSCKICEKLEVEEIAATGEHVFTVLESETPAGCETAGEKVYSCATHTDCGLTSTVTIPATGHTEELQYQAAACETVGSTKIVCDTCKATIGDETEIAALGHLFDGDGEYVAATCVAEGSMTYTCSRDDCEEKHITTISVDSDAHSLKKETKATSCKEEGYIKVTCENTGCTYSETTTLPKLQHSWGEWRVETAATNSADGVMKRTCSNGCEETCVIPAGNHKFDTTAPASTTAATCEIQGTATYNCTAHTDCGVTITVNTGLAEHIYKTEVVESCSENGSVKTICEVCEKEISSVALGKAQHKFNVTETVDATCTTSGYKIYKCDNCDETYNEINGNALGHEFTEKVSSDATCTTGGTMTLKCANCTETMSADVPALGHDYQKISSTPETCAAAATETYKCSRCDASYTISVGSKSATHTYIDNWTTVKEATATSIGYKTRACQVCGQLELQTIEATGEHQFETGEVVETKSATCTENGYEIRECSVHTDCGETAEITLLATGHTEEAIDAVAATCESAGSSAGTKCSVCGTVLDAPVTLPALEHKWEIKNITPATCKAEGKIEYTCSRDNCDETHEAAIEIDKDAHKYETTVTPASCIADGSVVTTCSLCGDTTTVTLTAKGHVWNDTAASTTFATCENSGSATYKCKHCDAENVVTLAPIGHTYEAGEKVAATCTTSGYTVYTCKNDSSHFYKVYDENEKATGHSFNGTETIVSDATCTADGEKTVKCETCSETTTVIIHKLGHAYGSWEVVKEATNTEDGQWKRVCANDESHIEYVTIPAGNHEWDDGTEILAPTCETEGTMLYKCKTHTGENACGITFETTIPATEHYYYASDTKDATCINEGEMLYECDCGASYTEPIPVKAHELSTTVTEATCTAEGSVVTECVNCDYEVTESLTQKPHTISVSYAYPSCTNDGYVKESCDKCDYEKIISTTAALGHDYNGEETVTKEATCLEKGEKTVKCSRCDATTTEEISATGHNYKAGDEVEATCTASGYIPYTCQNDGCTSSYRDLTSEPNGHKWNNTAESKTDATCETDGKAIYRCQFCDATNEVVTSKYGHSWTGWTITKAPTATEEGEKTRTCLRGCKETVSIPAIGSATTYKVDFVIDGEIIFSQTVGHLGSATAPEVSAKTPDAKYHYSFNWDTDFSVVSSDLTVTGIYTPVSHSYGEWVTDREADCKNEGLRHRECTCGYVQEETVAKAEHSFTVVTEEKAPTCTDNGYKVVTCEYCGESETQTVKKLGHAMTYYQGVAATCTTDGVASHYSCSRCGKNFEDRAGRTELSGIVINRKYHTYVVVEGKAPTCTEQGVTDYRYCTACGYTQNPEPIAATGHADVNNDNSCDKCGATYMQGGQIICSCSCHKTGFFNELIYKLLSFFWRLFGSNKSCECGRVHY